MIPNIIHMIWIGDKRFPFYDNLRVWKLLNPNYKIKLWVDDNLPVLQNQKEYDFLTNITAKTDLLRLEILYQFGGIYTDVDTICLHSIRPQIKGMTCFGMTGLKGNVANGFLGCMKNHPAFKEIIDKVPSHFKVLANSEKKDIFALYNITGTRYITPILRKYNDFKQLPRTFFCDFPEVTHETTIAHIAYGYNKGHKKINMKGYLEK